MIEKKCDICGEMAKAGPTEAQANRNLGWHKKKAHGIEGAWKQRYKNKYPKRGTVGVYANETKEQRAYRLNQMRRWRYNQKQKKLKAQAPEQQSTTAVDIYLKECPCCHARFYAVK